MPPKPPVIDFHSEKIVTPITCKPSDAATKYSPRTRKAGSASAIDNTAEMAAEAAMQSSKESEACIAM